MSRQIFKYIIPVVVLLSVSACLTQPQSTSIQDSTYQLNIYSHLIDSGRAYTNSGDYERAIPLIVEARSRSLKNADTLNYVRATRILMQLMLRTSQFHEAKDLCITVLPVAERNNYMGDYRSLLNGLGISYVVQGEYAKALELHTKLLQLYEGEKNWFWTTAILQNIGLTYYKMNHYAKAIEVYNRALQTAHASGSNQMSKALLINIGLAYTFLGQYSNASFYYNRVLRECKAECYSEAGIELHFGMGVMDYRLRNYESAYKNFTISCDLARQRDIKRFIADNLIYLARIYFQKHNFEEGLAALKECEKLSATHGYVELLLPVYNELSDFYRKENDYHQLSIYQDKYIKLRDSVYNDELTVSLMRLEAEYNERENIAIIRAQQEMLSLKESFIASQTKFRTLILSVAAVLVAIVIILIRNNLLKKSINQRLDLEVRKKTIELENGKRELLGVLHHHAQLLNKVHHTIKIAAGSLRGVCEVAMVDVFDLNTRTRLNKISKVSESLSDISKQGAPTIIEQSEIN